MDIWTTILIIINITAVFYVLLYGYDGLIRLILSLFRVASYADTLHFSPDKNTQSADSSMPVSLIVTECDKDAQPALTIEKLLKLDYPEFEVVAVCDSAKGKAFEKLRDAFSLEKIDQPIKRSVPMDDVRAVYRSPEYLNLVVLDYTAVSRSSKLNAGVNISRYPLFITVDIGSYPDADALSQASSAFSRSHRVFAAGSLTRINTETTQPIGAIGALMETDYLRTYPAGLALPDQKKLKIIPGAFCAFRKQTVIKEGGFVPGSSETDMVLRISKSHIKNRQEYDICLLPVQIMRSGKKPGIKSLISNCVTYSSDMRRTLSSTAGMFFNPSFGRAGLLDIPYRWFFDVIGPVIELLGCIAIPLSYALGIIGFDILLAFLAAEFLLGTIVSLSAVLAQEILDSDVLSLKRTSRRTLCAVLNNLGYRQIMLIFRVAGLFKRR